MKKKVEYTDDRGELPERLLVVAEDVLPSPAEFARGSTENGVGFAAIASCRQPTQDLHPSHLLVGARS